MDAFQQYKGYKLMRHLKNTQTPLYKSNEDLNFSYERCLMFVI